MYKPSCRNCHITANKKMSERLLLIVNRVSSSISTGSEVSTSNGSEKEIENEVINVS